MSSYVGYLTVDSDKSQVEWDVLLGCNKNWATLAPNYMLKNSEKDIISIRNL